MSEKLRLLVFMHCSGLAGAERSVLELVHQLRADFDVAIKVVLPYDGPLRQRLESDGAETTIVDAGWWCEHDRHRLAQDVTTLLAAISERPGDFDADVVMTMSITIPWGAIAASLLGKPHVWYVRETGDFQPFVMPTAQVIRAIDQSSNAVIAISRAVRSVLGSIGDEKVSVVPPHIPGVEPRLRPWTAQRDRAPRIVYPGTKSLQKAQDDAIRAVAALKARGRDVELALIGPGPDSENSRLAMLVTELGVRDRVEISGFRHDILDVMAQADIVVDCTNEPALGRVILEAMLIGTPVIATRSGGATELCQDGEHGLQYDAGDAESLASAIESVLDVPDETAARVQQALRFANAYNQRDRYGRAVFDVIRSTRGAANPIPDTWPRLLIGIVEQAESSRLAARLDAERAAAASREAIDERDVAAAAARYWEAEAERRAGETAHWMAEAERMDREREQATEERDQVTEQYHQLHSQRELLVRERTEIIRTFETHIAAMESTIVWRSWRKLQQTFDRVFPSDSRRRRILSHVVRRLLPR